MSLLRTMILNVCVFFIYLGRLIFKLIEQNGNSLNANSPSNTYITAMIFSLAHPYGTPTILSSYYGFTNTDAGAPDGG